MVNTNQLLFNLALAAAVVLGGCSPTTELPQTHARAWVPPTEGMVWNQWLGSKRDGLSPDETNVDSWPAEGPALVWKATGLGAGFSSVTFGGNRIFTMGDGGGASRLFALDAADGAIVWHAKVGADGPPNRTKHPGPRSTPCTDGTLVFGLGHEGELVCVAAEDGAEKWRRNLPRDFGGEMMSKWGVAESPLIDGERLVCTPGGPKGTVVALRKDTGEQLWRCTELKDQASYASLIVAEIGGVRQYIVLTGFHVAGIDAKTGALLWSVERKGRTAVCTTPVYRDGVVFVSSGYNAGCHAFRITAQEGSFTAVQIYGSKDLMSQHGGVVLVGDHVYGTGRRNLKCLELTTGKVVWEDHSVGKGSIAYADGHLVVRSERGAGSVALVEATPTRYVEKGRFDPVDPSGEKTWTYPVIHGGKLYLRDQDVLLCYAMAK